MDMFEFAAMVEETPIRSRLFEYTDGRRLTATLRDMAAAGRITPVVDRVVGFDEAVDAVAAVGAGDNRGTKVITV